VNIRENGKEVNRLFWYDTGPNGGLLKSLRLLKSIRPL
jgi:hypothetical protein